MAQNFSLTRRKRPAASEWKMPTAAFSNVPRKRSSLSRRASSVWRRSVISVQVPNHLKMPPSLSRIGQCAPPGLALGQRLLCKLDLGDVAGDAERADDLTIPVAEGHLGGGNPSHSAIEPGLLFLFTHYRLAGADDLLFVRVGRPG